jgi:hypothetical protein
MDRNTRPVPMENGPAIGFTLAHGDNLAACRFKRYVHASNTGEK